MIPIVLLDVERELLQPYIDRNVTGLPKFTADDLVDGINAVPDTIAEKGLLIHYWMRLSEACEQKNGEAIAGWLVAAALAAHTTGFLLPKASGKVKSEKALKAARPAGTKALKEKSEHRLDQLRQDIDAYITGNPLALKRGATTCRNALRSRGLMHDYSDSYVLQQIKLAFAEHRRQKAEITKAS